MTSPWASTPTPEIQFPRFADFSDLNSLSIVIQDLSLIYDISAIAVLPGYGQLRMPDSHFGPRRWSPLRTEDRLRVKQVSLASPLTIILDTAGLSATFGTIALVTNRVLVSAKTFTDILASGTDVQQRRQALAENRHLAPVRLRNAELQNELLVQQIRRATAEADIVEGVRNKIVFPEGFLDDEKPPRNLVVRERRRAASLSNEDFAELLDEPMRRLLAYGGGELEVSGDEHASPEDA